MEQSISARNQPKASAGCEALLPQEKKRIFDDNSPMNSAAASLQLHGRTGR